MKKLIAIALIAAPFAAFADTNLLNNGSFEADAMGNGQWAIASALTGWTAAAGGVELRNNVAGSALDGLQFVELDTTGNSSISQSVATVAGQWYALSFSYANREGVSSASNGLGWSFGSASGTAAALPLTHSGSDWAQFSTVVQASGSSTTLSFAALGTSDSLGTSLDKISVTAVPEPQTYALMLAGLGAISFVARRRKQA